MSEYQYYEFQAVDRPLTSKQMAELRSFSTRARITPTTFINDYSWGGFKGDEDLWMERYFDAFLYLANWGTRVVKLALPSNLLDPNTAGVYCAGEPASVRDGNGKAVLTFQTEDDEAADWIDGDGWLSSFVSVRADLANGDHRPLYLGWLLCAQQGYVEDDDLEPPIPPGLGQLGLPLQGLVEFLRIDTDLLAAAAARSVPLIKAEPKRAEVLRWLAKLPVKTKDEFLARLMAGDSSVAHELAQRMRDHGGGRDDAARQPTARTAGELLSTAKDLSEARRRVRAKRAAQETARHKQEAATARARHLDRLSGRESELWTQVEELIATRRPRNYDEAVTILVDLRDLGKRCLDGDFHLRLGGLRTAHSQKDSLIRRLEAAGL